MSRAGRAPRTWRGAAARLTPLRPYAAAALISTLLVSRWFEPGTFIATGDIGPFLRTGWMPETTSAWNHTITGAGSAAHTVSRVFETFLIQGLAVLGGDEYLAQWLFYVLCYGLVAVGTTYAARALVRNEPASVAAGAFAVLNGFFLTRIPNPLNIISVGTLALITGLALRVAAGRTLPAVWAGFAVLPMGFLAFNPPMFLVAAVWTAIGMPVLALMVSGWRGLGRLLRWFVPAGLWAVAINAFWLVPFGFVYLGGGAAVDNGDFRDATAWAWSQAQNQIPNVLTLVANWAWVKPQYLPFAADMDQPLLVWLRYLVPALLFLTPVLCRPRLRRAALAMLGLALISVALAKGLQPPFAQANLWLYEHVPMFWLFREPMSKLGQVLVVAIALSIALLLDGVWWRRHQRSPASLPGRLGAAAAVQARALGAAAAVRARALRAALPGRAGAALGGVRVPDAGHARVAAAWLVVVAVVVQVFPLWSGAVIPDVRPMQPSAHVRVPAFWRDLAAHLNDDTRSGRVLVLPLDDYYQMPTTWGFAGVDSVANLLIQHPVVQPKPDGYYGEVAGFSANITAIETALLAGDLAAVPRLLAANQISRVIVRHDLVRGLPGRLFADDATLAAALRHTPELNHTRAGTLDLFELGDGSLPLVRGYNTVLRTPARPSAGAAVLGTIPASQAIQARPVDPKAATQVTDDVVQWPVPAVDAGVTPKTTVKLSKGTYTVAQRARAGAVLVPSVRHRSVVLSDPTEVRLDGRVVSTRPELVVPLTGRAAPLAVTAGTRTVSLDGWARGTLPGATAARPRPAYLPVQSDTPLTVWGPARKPARPAAPSPVYDCANYEPRPAAELGLRLTRTADATGPVLRLAARDHAACTRIEVRDAAPGRTYRVRMEYRTVVGKRPQVCLWQLDTDGCDLTAKAPSVIGRWKSYEEFLTVEDVADGLQVILYANVGVRHMLRTVTEYRRIRIEALEPIVQTRVFPPQVPQTRVRVPAGRHELSVTGGPSGSMLMPFGELEDCFNSDDAGFEAAGLSVRRLRNQPQPAYRLTARAHKACIGATVPDMGSSSLYQLSFEGRQVQLRDPQVCLYLRGPDQCQKIPVGPTWRPGQANEWTRWSTFVSADPRAVETRLYLYGSRDLREQQQAIVEFRDVQLRPVAAPVDVVLVRERDDAAAPAVTARERSAANIDVSADGLTAGQTAVALAETYASGWAPSPASGLDTASHRVLQGWMNAWVATDATIDGTLTYGPDRAVQLALRVSVVALAAAAVWLAVRAPVLRFARRLRRRRLRLRGTG